MQQNETLVQAVMNNNDEYSLQQPSLQQQLAEAVNFLILHQFDELIRLLYRIDVHEQKLKQLLREHPQEDAGNIIASLIIERQLQKIKSRREFGRDTTIIPEEERW